MPDYTWNHDWEYSSRNKRQCKKCGVFQTKETNTTGRISIKLYNPKWLPKMATTCKIQTVEENVETNQHRSEKQTDTFVLS